jgi:restriction system protein
MLPLLSLLADGQPHQLDNLKIVLADQFKLSAEEKKLLLKSGREEIFSNRVGWARTYLKNAGLVKSVAWGVVQITDKGKLLLEEKPNKIDLNVLSRYPDFMAFFKGGKPTDSKPEFQTHEQEKRTPKELIDSANKQINDALENAMLQQVKKVSPTKFEHIVIDLLVTMGYGGSFEDAAKAIGGSGDEGLDGEIKEDKLGLSKIYV